jgi:DMSO reductase family type II enzyme chaperone
VHTSSANTNIESDDVCLSLDRARVYRALAQLFRPPDADSLEQARENSLPELCDALQRLDEGGAGASSLVSEAKALCALLADTELERLRAGHEAAFDESSRTRCAPTEMDQLDGAPQLELTRTFEMADVAGFYRAFGVEVGQSGERPDHIAAELEFMNLLAVKEAIALQLEGDGEHAEICRDASRAFLRDHLGRWAPRLGERLAASDGEPVYGHAGRLLGDFVAFDAVRIDAAGAPLHDRSPRAQLGAGQRS